MIIAWFIVIMVFFINIMMCIQHFEKFCANINLMYKVVIMATLRSRCGHDIFALWFLSFSSSSNFRGHRLDVYHTSTHDVVLVQI